MTTAQDQLADLTERGQKAFAKAFESWTERVQDYSANFRNGHYGLPTADNLVNDVFDFAEEVLRAQREVATSLLSAGSKVSEATKKVTEQAAAEAQAAVEKVTEEVKSAGAKASRRTTTT
jgi:topoisomerase IA-like protein